MRHKVFVSYSHRLDQGAAEDFRSIFGDDRNVFIDKSIRDDVGCLAEPTIKKHLSRYIRDSSVTVVLIGAKTGGRWWIDWEIYHSLRTTPRSTPSGLLGIRIPYKQHRVPARLNDNIPTMGEIIDWPRDRRTLVNAIDRAFVKRNNTPDLHRALRVRNSYGH